MDFDIKKNKRRSLTRQSQILIMGQVAAFAFNFIVPIIVVRFFDVAQYGIYKQLFLVFMTVILILPLGIIESLYYFVPRNREQKQYYITQSALFLALAGVLFLILMVLFREQILSSLNLSHLYEFSIPLTLYIVFMTLSLPLEKLMIIEEQVKASASVTIVSEILKGLCIISATVITKELKVVLYTLTSFSLLRLFAYFYYLKMNNLLWLFGTFDYERVKEQIRYSFPFGCAVAVSTIRRFLHQYFVSFLFDIKDFAIYAVGSFQLPLMNIIYSSVSNVVLVRISEYQQLEKYEDIIQIWLNGTRKLALIYFPITVFFIFVSEEFITAVFTERYLSSVPIFIVTLLRLPTDIFITHTVLKAFAETKFIFKLNVVILIMTGIFVYFFIHIFGMIGAAVGTVLSFVLIRIIEILKIRKLIGIKLNRLIPWKILIKIMSISIICGIISSYIKSLDFIHSAALLFVSEAGLFTSLYVLAVYFSGLLTKGEKEDVFKLLHRLNPMGILR
jgi:O-antigen/teichoic acid export membrane protein